MLKCLLYQWAENTLSSCPSSLARQLAGPLSTLQAALKDITRSYTHPVPPLLPRPALFVFCHVASALHLLEHAVWASKNGESTAEVDVEVFRRWVEEGGLNSAIESLHQARDAGKDRSAMDSRIVYGDAPVVSFSLEDRIRAQL